MQDLIDSNIKTMTSLNTSIMTTFMNEFEKKIVYPKSSDSTDKKVEVTRVTMLTKPFGVTIWTKDMSLETYIKQLAFWTEINEDVPE